MVAVEGRIEVTHDLAYRLAVATDDDAVRTAAVGDRRALLEKLGVGHDIELQDAPVAVQPAVYMGAKGIASAHRHGGFFHHDQGLLAVPGHGVAHRQHITQVGRAILSGGCTHGNEQYLAMLDRLFLVCGELQAPAFQAFTDQAGQPGFENAHMALLQQRDLLLIDVHADHIVTHFGQHGSLYKADVATTNDTDFHGVFLTFGVWIPRELMVRTPRMTNATPRVLERLNGSLNSGRLAASRYTRA
ncbi:hypothetical protein D3C85_671210 [compost metagenome]